MVTKRFNDHNKWFIEKEGQVYYKGKLYIPKNLKTRAELIFENHDTVLAGHPGQYKMFELISRNVWWPGMLKDVTCYVKGCEKCQRTKINREARHVPLNPNLIPIQPWDKITVDMIGHLPKSKGYDVILVVVEWMGKMIHVLPTSVELTSEGLAKLYRDHIWKDFGLPKKVTSDRGPQFNSNFINNMCNILGMSQNLSTAYHPQTDGQMEKMNQEIEQYLHLFVNHHQSDWADWLSLAEFQYNDKIHSATGQTPFYVNYGRHPWKGDMVTIEGKNKSVANFTSRIKAIREEVVLALQHAMQKMKEQYDQNKKPSRKYNMGDKVWLEATNLKTDQPMKKLDNKHFGPFQIIKQVGAGSYELDIPKTWKMVHPVFNETLLSPYHKAHYQIQHKEILPPLEIIDGNKEYEVEEVLDSRNRRGITKYLVHWKGYPREERMWEPAENMKHAKKLIEFYRIHPKKPWVQT